MMQNVTNDFQDVYQLTFTKPCGRTFTTQIFSDDHLITRIEQLGREGWEVDMSTLTQVTVPTWEQVTMNGRFGCE